MNNYLANRLLRGDYAGKAQRQANQLKRLVARQCHKPHNRLRVRVQSDWAFY